MKIKLFFKPLLYVVVVFMALGLTSALVQANVIKNGDFQLALQDWILSPKIAPNWNPIREDGTNRYVNLHPTYPSGYTGIILYQNLNVTLGTNKTVDFSVKMKKNYGSAANPIAFYLEYVEGAASTLKTVLLANPDVNSISDAEFTLISNSIVLPTAARKISRFYIAKKDYGDFNVDDVSINVAGAVIGPLPLITSISTDKGDYGSELVIKGMNFGTTAGSVFIGGSSAGINVVSWSEASITVRVQEPASSGRVYIVSDFVQSNIDQTFRITSPYFTFEVFPQELTVVKGVLANFGVAVIFHNDFTTQGGVSFVVADGTDLAGLSSFAPVPVKSSGGTVLSIDTRTLAPGVYKGSVKSVEANSLERVAPFVLNVIEVYDISFNSGYPDYTPIASLEITKQGQFYVYYKVLDTSGNEIPWGIKGRDPAFESSDPSKLLVHKDPWGYYFFAQESGTANLTARTADGRTKTLPVSISIPDDPKVLSIGLSPSVVTNKHADPINFSAQTTPTSSVSLNTYGDFIDYESKNIDFNWSTYSYSGTFKILPNVNLGQYRMSVSIPEAAERAAILEVINDPSHGLISGIVKSAGGGYEGPAGGFHGSLRFYDASTGEMVKEVWVYGMADTYKISLPAGNYKVEARPYSISSQFYANAKDLQEASVVTVSAGQETKNINFVLLPGLTMFGSVWEEGIDDIDVPVANAQVQIFDIDGTSPIASAWSNADGTFYISGLQLGIEGYAKVSKSEYKDTYSYVHMVGFENLPDVRLEIIPLTRFDEVKSAIETAVQGTYDSTKGVIGGLVVQWVGDNDMGIPGAVVELWNREGTEKIIDMLPIYFNDLGEPDATLSAITSDGGFVFFNVPPAMYMIKAFIEGAEKGSAKAGAFANGLTLGEIEVLGVLPPYIARAFSAQQAQLVFGHAEEQYWVGLSVEDPESKATSVSVVGPGITNSLQLEFDSMTRRWESWRTAAGNPNFGPTQPALPLVYTFTIADNTGTVSIEKTINSFVNVFATNLLPTGIITDPMPTFSWVVEGTGFRYGIELYNQTWQRIWNVYNLTTTQRAYDGPTLLPGRYNYNIVINDTAGNISFTPGSFTYQPVEDRGDLNGDKGLSLDDAIIALKVISGMSVPELVYDFTKNDVDGVPGVGLAEAIYVLQKLAVMR